jgi:adenylate cyclase
MNKFTSTWAVVVSVVILLCLKLYNPLPLQTLQLKTFDLYQKFGTNYQSKSLVLLDISDEALRKQGQWPWKRDILGRTIINAYKNGAALVFLNVVFVHKDRLGGDEMFLKMITKYPVILTETKDAKNLTSIERKALGVGNVEVPIDVDGTIRKLPLDKSVPSVIMKVIKFPIPKQDNIWIDFRHQIPRVDYTDKDWSSMKGKIVFIGTTFKGSTFVLTPNGLKNTHEIMALSTETLLSGKYITRPDWVPVSEWTYLILALGFFLLVIPRVGLMWSALWLVGFYFELIITSGYIWQKYMILTDWSSIAFIVSIVWAHLIYNNFARENRLKLQIKKQFEHYLSPDMVKKLQKNPSLLKLGGETKELTFLFSDIRGFTPLSEKYQSNPADLTKVINKFLTPMTNIIMKNGGTIDKYMGDCIMAFWNAPIDTPNHKELAINSALEMIDKLKELNNNNGFGDSNKINIGIGINTGKCIVGNMGSEQRFDYSVIGDAVNLASRLEGVSKNYDATLVVGEDTYRDISTSFNFKKLDTVKVKGKSNKVSIYTIERENGLGNN